MTLKEALEILELTPEYTEDGEPIGELAARKLGIEALKRIQDSRHGMVNIFQSFLPGETKE
jgi:hypothetical protein